MKKILFILLVVFCNANVYAFEGKITSRSSYICNRDEKNMFGAFYGLADTGEKFFFLVPQQTGSYNMHAEYYLPYSVDKTGFNENIYDIVSYYYYFETIGDRADEYFYKFLWEYLYPSFNLHSCSPISDPNNYYSESLYKLYKEKVLGIMQGFDFAGDYETIVDVPFKFSYDYLIYYELVDSDGADVKVLDNDITITLPEDKDYHILFKKKNNDGAETRQFLKGVDNYLISYSQFKEEYQEINFISPNHEEEIPEEDIEPEMPEEDINPDVPEENIDNPSNEEEISFIPERTLKFSPIVLLPIALLYVFIKKIKLL